MSKNKKIVAGLIMGAAALAIMLFASMPSANSKEITISDLLQAPGQYAGEYIMTQGLLGGQHQVGCGQHPPRV